jgi:methylthioribose-1-phosphate isomerase
VKNLTSLGLRYENGKLLVLDQQLLPHEEKWLCCETPDQMVEIIKALKVRGAPLIGVAAALSLGHYKEQGASEAQLRIAARKLRDSRPTAVNLMTCIDRILSEVSQVTSVAEKIFEEDVELCEHMGLNGEHLINDGDHILTHCNTGGLATAGIGTALGVIRKAHEKGKRIHVYVDETRPLLQGARLTTWELQKLGIPYTLICDNMAASLMKKGKIQKIFLGADRVATNGDFANKIGTYSVAVIASYHKVPFYTVAPYTTIDFECSSGKDIPIEERNASEVKGVAGSFGSVQWAPGNAQACNPSFDVTPCELLTGMVLDKGFFSTQALQKGALLNLK